MQTLRLTSAVVPLLLASAFAGELDSGGTLYWGNGDSLNGTLVGARGDTLTWKSPLFADPLTMDLAVLSTVRFPELEKSKLSPGSEDFRITLINDNIVFGTLSDVTAETLVFTSQVQGDFVLNRNQIRRMERGNNAGLIYTGPRGLDEWKPSGVSDWKEDDNGSLFTAKGECTLRQDIKLPDTCEIELVVASSQVPDFSLRLGGSTKSLALRLETWDDSLVIAIGNDFEPLESIPDDSKTIHAHLFVNREAGFVGVFSGSGRKLGELRSKKLASLASIGSLTLEAVDSPLKIERIQVQGWNGILPRKLETGENRMQLVDGGARYGTIVGYSADTKTIQFDTGGVSKGTPADSNEAAKNIGRETKQDDQENNGDDKATEETDGDEKTSDASVDKTFDLPVDKIAAMVLSVAPAVRPTEGETAVAWQDGGFVSGELVSLTADSVSLKTSFSDQPITRMLAGVRRIRFPNTHKPPQEPDTLFFYGGSLHGNLTLDDSDEPIRWTPVGGRNATTLVSAGDARFQRGAEPEDIVIDSVQYPDVLYMKSGDVFPCRVSHCDDTIVSLISPVSPVKQLKTSLVRAIEFGTSDRSRQASFAAEGWKAANTTLQGTAISVTNQARYSNKTVLTGDSVSMSLRWKNSTYGSITFFLFASDTISTESATPVTLQLQPGSLTVSQQVNNDANNMFGLRFGAPANGDSRTVLTKDNSANIEFRIKDGRVYVVIDNKDVADFVLEPPTADARGLIIKCNFMRVNVTGRVKDDNLLGDAELDNFLVRNVFGATAKQFIQEEARVQTLTTPRFRRDDPPTHVIIAPNGDLLRGRLKEIRPEEIVFESRLEEFRFPRSRVSSIIWLIKDEAELQTVVERPETAVQIQMDKGYTLTMTPKRMNDGKLVGDSVVLGECRIPGKAIRDLFLGDPAGHSEVVSFVQWIRQDAKEPEWEKSESGDGNAESQMVGQKIEDFELPMLDGGTFRLSEHTGKIVVLDFWASWCGPCVAALPEYVKATSAFPEDEVIFVAINLEESEQRITAFLEQNRLSPLVAMDRGSVIARRFNVSGIPHSVMLNAEGVVEHVTVGYQPGVGQKTSERIKQLLTPQGLRPTP